LHIIRQNIGQRVSWPSRTSLYNKRNHYSPSFPICRSKDWRTNPMMYGSSSNEVKATSTSPLPWCRPGEGQFLTTNSVSF